MVAEPAHIARSRDPDGAAALCQGLVADLPEWFADEAANRAYATDARTLPGLVASRGSTPLGLVLLTQSSKDTTEIHFLAVRRAAHRQGIGALLVRAALDHAAQQSAQFLTVKTLATSCNYTPYLETHRFYRAMGFRDIMEYREPGWRDPALLMARTVQTA